ncbi:regulator [Streptomyces hygroscopicus subsp. jinggangensis 5008]|nr:regulator [Streptomyces hygroscopicus subsp. jinggangensis 5008]
MALNCATLSLISSTALSGTHGEYGFQGNRDSAGNARSTTGRTIHQSARLRVLYRPDTPVLCRVQPTRSSPSHERALLMPRMEAALSRRGTEVSTSFSVLGPLRAWDGTVELSLGPPKQRGLLALLLARAGQPVTTHEIVDVLWGQDPPDTAVNVIQRHVGALRRLLEPDLPAGISSRWLVRGSGGYRLDVGVDNLDLLQFRSLRQDAEQEAQKGQSARAAGLLMRALELWRGPVATGIAPVARAHPIFTTVDREQIAAVDRAAALAAQAGPALSQGILPVLHDTAALHPLDETLQARLVTLLAITGRQAEAQKVYHSVRLRLAQDLGVEPGAELRAAWRMTSVATTDAVGYRGSTQAPSPSASRIAAPPTQPTPQGASTVSRPNASITRPAQLPLSSAAFIGRKTELTFLEQLLSDKNGQAGPAVVSTIVGTAGVGKTALSVHFAHRAADLFPDGQLYADLRGFHPQTAMTTGETVQRFLDALGVPANRIPSSLDGQTALYRSLLADRRLLIVLDNVSNSEHVRPLLPGFSPSLVIVTSRNRLSGLVAETGAHCTTLGLLSTDDAHAFLSRRLGAKRVLREAGAANEIIKRCARLPLALAIVSARAALNPSFSLTAIADELDDQWGCLDALTAEEPLIDTRSSFSWSYRKLSPDAARLFRLLSLQPALGCTATTAATLAGLPVTHTKMLLSELNNNHILAEAAPGCYTSHELLRRYAKELCNLHTAPAEVRAARDRLLKLRQQNFATAPTRSSHGDGVGWRSADSA